MEIDLTLTYSVKENLVLKRRLQSILEHWE